MKHRKISLKWKIFMYILVFVALLLIVLWLFQTVYLDDFYRSIKLRELNRAMNRMEGAVAEGSFSEVEELAYEYNVSVVVGREDGTVLVSARNNENPEISPFSKKMVQFFFREAKQKGGSATISISRSDPLWDNHPEMEEKGDKADFRNKKYMDASPYNVKIVEDGEQNQYVLAVHCVLTPVEATVHTLRIQLICITVVLMLLALVIAFLMAKSVSKSIAQVNKSAKELARGNYNIEFEGKDYREIAELSDTLNYTAGQLGKSEVLQRELIANVSHDLRTPLTMITAYSEVMRDIPGENTPENVQVIIDEANRLTRLVNDLMDISKIQAGVTPLETKEYDITESIRVTVERYAKLLEPYGYNLTFVYDTHAIVEGDEFKIYQVIYNLIGNAVNYTGEDREIRVIQKVNGETVRIEVQDTGAGIPEKELEYVWERYYKIDKTHKRAVMGTGLGLSIVKNILKLHQADFGVDSQMGKGSTFWFELQKVRMDDEKEGVECP